MTISGARRWGIPFRRHIRASQRSTEPTPLADSDPPEIGGLAPSTPTSALHHMFGRDFFYVFGGVLPLALSALILPLLTRLMGPQQFGIVSLAIAISSVLFILLSFGMQTGIQREYPRPGGVKRSREIIAVSTVCIAVLTVILAWTSTVWAGLVRAEQFPWAMKLMAEWSGAAAVALVCLGFLRSADRLSAYLIVVFTQSIGAQAIGVALLLLRGHTAHNYLIGIVVGQFIAALLALVLVRPRIAGLTMFTNFGRVLTFSLPLVPLLLSNFVLWSGDRIIVQGDLGSTSQARYAVAYAVGAMAINLTSQLNQAWMPRVFGMSNLQERRNILAQIQKQLLDLLSPTVIGISLIVPLLLIIAAPASYHPHTLVFVTVLIVPTALPYSVVLANTRTLLAHGKSARLAGATLVCAVINIALNVVLVPQMGISGSALATLISYALLGWGSSLLVMNDEDRLPHRFKTEMFQWCVVGACVLTTVIPDGPPGTALRTIGFIAAASLVAIRASSFRKPKSAHPHSPHSTRHRRVRHFTARMRPKS